MTLNGKEIEDLKKIVGEEAKEALDAILALTALEELFRENTRDLSEGAMAGISVIIHNAIDKLNLVYEFAEEFERGTIEC